ncbi:MAG: murein biosynthesis integral membrane protein MurJ [Rhizobiales bacterium]|nr:murein biosynthesis integral membrane protein MurJ [Hyphomicrobiales bacterium]
MSIARNVATVGTATLLSRGLGFVRDVGIAAVLGAGALSDAFFAALQISNLFRRLLAEGALNSAFVPMWLRIRDEDGPAQARRFGEEVFGTMLVVLGAVAVLCVVFAPIVVHLLAPGFSASGERYAWAIDFVRLSVPYVAIAGLVAVAASILNAEGRVGAVAFGLVVFNVVLVAAVGILLLSGMLASPDAGAILSASIVVAGFAQFLLVGGGLLRLEAPPVVPRIVPSTNTTHFFALALPGVVAGGIPQLKLMAGAMVVSASESAVSWLYYANRLYELPLGVVSIAIATVLVPTIAASVRTGDRMEVAATQSRAFEFALGLSFPAAVAFAILAQPIAGGLFERGAFGPTDTAAVAAALAAISAGLPGHVIEKVLGAISFAHEDTRTPMFAALAGLAIALAGALALFPLHGHVGVAAAIAISGWVGATLLGAILAWRGWLRFEGRALLRRLSGIALATLAMAGAILGLERALSIALDLQGSAVARASALILLVVVGLVTYLLVLQILGVARIRELVTMIRDRL